MIKSVMRLVTKKAKEFGIGSHNMAFTAVLILIPQNMILYGRTMETFNKQTLSAAGIPR